MLSLALDSLWRRFGLVDKIRPVIDRARARSEIMAEGRRFQYRPMCSYPQCDQPATSKVGATWTDGTSRELKNYGLACDKHGPLLLELASKKRNGLRLADGETVGPVMLFRLEPGRRDSALNSIETNELK